MKASIIKTLILIGWIVIISSCSKTVIAQSDENPNKSKKEVKGQNLPKIDLSHWKVTLPIGTPPIEVDPPAILDYASNETLKPFMYNDTKDGSIVFYAYPESTTANTSYSRSELREQMVPGKNNVNWTFAQGGKMKGTLKMEDISRGKDGKYHRAIVMQIHGRLSNAQRDLIGQKDNNAPPVLKIYWNEGRVRVIRKVLVDSKANEIDILKEESWTDEGVWLGTNVDFKKFTLEVIITKGRMEVILNDTHNVVWQDIHMEKWGVFENYFKAGNYFQSKEKGSFAKVKYYDLSISH